jgi:two-component sensor histidine kinase/DNA-binding NarL/FixJ family response regulator
MITGPDLKSSIFAPDRGRILIVDDDVRNLKLLEAILTAEGHSTIGATNGEEALRLTAEVEPDLILLDIMMPGVDGFSILHKIKSSADTMNIPVVMVTSLHDQESRIKALETGAEDFITKPFSKPELAARVRSLLKVKAYYDSLKDQQITLEEEVARKTESLENYSRRLEIVSQASVQINSILEVSSILRSVVHAALELMECDGGAAAVFEDGALLFQEHYWKGTHYKSRFRCDIMKDLTDLPNALEVQCCANRHPDEECRFEKVSGGRIHERLAIPIFDRHRKIMGCILLFNPVRQSSEHRVSENPLLGLISSAATALENTKNIIELRNKENALISSLKEKDLLLKEIHHRVKNNLQAIVALLERHLSAVETSRDREIFLKGQSLAMSMSMIHELLYDTDDFTRVNFAEYTRKLVDNSLRLYSGERNRIKVELDVDEICLNTDTAIPVSLIINELVSNALTHAYPDNSDGLVKISMKKVGRGGFVLEIADDGIGLPENKRIGKSTTLGLELVRSLTEHLHGTVQTRVDRGTTFILRLKEYFECENLELG